MMFHLEDCDQTATDADWMLLRVSGHTRTLWAWNLLAGIAAESVTVKTL